MRNTNRRQWLKAGVAGMTALAYQRVGYAAAFGAKPSIAFIGCGGRTQSLKNDFAKITDVHWACDPDQDRAQAMADSLGGGDRPQATSDLRKVIDDRNVDAVVIATPDHWHAPAAIMSCEAGKHVYVEKPCSHNFREGQWLLEAARRNGVVVQHGTQSRNNPLIAGAIELIEGGAIGEVLACKAWNVQRRRDIGRAKPEAPPKHVDYDLWVGPAAFMPYQSNRFHYDWHWWYNFGTGDIGNDGTHEIDIARWGLGVTGLPSQASAVGGKLYFEDDQQFPDTATCVFQWPEAPSGGRPKQLIFEMRIWSKSYPHNVDTGVEFYGTDGMLFVSKRGKIQLWDADNKPVRDVRAESNSVARSHQLDFIESIAESKRPAADIEIGHDSCSLVHLANASLRVGRSLNVDVAESKIKGDPQANELLGRTYRADGHWAIPNSVQRSGGSSK